MKYVTTEQYEIAEKNGIKKGVVNQRVHRYDWSVEKAITEPVMNPFGNKERIFTDEQLEIAKKNGISEGTAYQRYRNGKSIEESILPKSYPRKYPVELIVKAKRNGIGYRTLMSRLNRNWDIETAITKPIDERRRKKHE